MPTWTQKAFEDNVPVVNNKGTVTLLSSDQIDKLIKKKLLESAAVRKIFDDFDVSYEQIKKLKIIITNLDKRYAETDLQSMKINKTLFEDGKFFEKHFYIVVHEIVHFLTRVQESEAYLNDPEEVLGFVASAAYLLENQKSDDEIRTILYPKLSFHFNDKNKADIIINNMIMKARKLIKNK